jgi:hypothetical protein
MTFQNNIVLRPRFKLNSNKTKAEILEQFRHIDIHKTGIRSGVIDAHIFLKITKKNRHFWSPQLHLEVFENDKGCRIHGLFGPNAKLWTFFMFLHFLVAGVFIGAGIWAYVNWSLDQPIGVPVFLILLMILFWIILYFAGRLGKDKGKKQMRVLYNFTTSKI